MTPIDFAKALLTAVLIMVLNVAISFAVVAVYSYAVDPGHDEAYYQAMAERIAPWSSVVFGIPLFYVASFVLARRKPERPAVGFALTVAGIYIAADAALIFFLDALSALGAIVPLSFATKLIAAFAGARMGRVGNAPAS